MSDVAAQITANNGKFAECIRAGDNARLLPPGAAPVQGREKAAVVFDGYMKAGIKNAALKTDEIVQVAGDYVTERGNYTMYTGEGKIADIGKYVVIWKKVGGKYLMDVDIWNSNGPVQA